MSEDEAPPPEKEKKAAPKENVYDSKVFLAMENVVEKMKLMNYEVNFCAQRQIDPFTRTAFALPAMNPGTQFNNFMSAVEWLCEEATGDRRAFSVDSYDDPNTSVNKLMLALRNMGFGADFPVGKLKLGHGEAPCNVLDFLCDKALKARGFEWQSPVHEEPAEVEEAEVDADADLGEGIADNVDAVEEDDEVYGGGGGKGKDGEREGRGGVEEEGFVGDAAAHAMIENTIDPLLWKTELERVGPRLKAAGGASLGKEWRAHIEQTKAHETTIQTVLPGAQGHMKGIAAQVKAAVEQMRATEQGVNGQFEALRSEHAALLAEKQAATEKHDGTRAHVAELTGSMGGIQEQLDELKADMEQRQSLATDMSPLMNIKKALVGLKGDVNKYDLEIGIVGHTLMQAKLKAAKARGRSGAGSDKDGGKGGGPSGLGDSDDEGDSDEDGDSDAASSDASDDHSGY